MSSLLRRPTDDASAPPGSTERARRAAACALVVGLALVVACSSARPAPASDDAEPCGAISAACSGYADATGPVAECLALGRAGDQGRCASRWTECLEACPVADAGGAGRDATADAAGDVVCGELCACLAAACATQDGYPFAAEGACLRLGAAERDCYPKWCARAMRSGDGHECAHAWGEFGLLECETL